MMVSGAICLLFFSVVGALVVPPRDEKPIARNREIACDRSFLSDAWSLLAGAAYGASYHERAAFVLSEADGLHTFQIWPSDRSPFMVAFVGEIPPGTVAIMHTHPSARSDLPSPEDQFLARRSGLPVYVVSRRRISKTDGSTTRTLWVGDWNPRLGGRKASTTCMGFGGSLAPARVPDSGHPH